MSSYQLRSWSSGMMLACHAGDPGSIPGERTRFIAFLDAPQWAPLAGLFRTAKITLRAAGGEKWCQTDAQSDSDGAGWT